MLLGEMLKDVKGSLYAKTTDWQGKDDDKDKEYVQIEKDVYEKGGRWYCTIASWPISPAARGGAKLETKDSALTDFLEDLTEGSDPAIDSKDAAVFEPGDWVTIKNKPNTPRGEVTRVDKSGVWVAIQGKMYPVDGKDLVKDAATGTPAESHDVYTKNKDSEVGDSNVEEYKGYFIRKGSADDPNNMTIHVRNGENVAKNSRIGSLEEAKRKIDQWTSNDCKVGDVSFGGKGYQCKKCNATADAVHKIVHVKDSDPNDKPFEAYGVKGMKSASWRKTFKNQQEFEKWLDKNEGDVEVYGTRSLDSKDATSHAGEKTYQTYAAWKAACKTINASVQFEGDQEICEAKPGIGQWDGNSGVIYTKDAEEYGPDFDKKKPMYKTAKYKGSYVGLNKYFPEDDSFGITTLSKANLRVPASELSNFVL